MARKGDRLRFGAVLLVALVAAGALALWLRAPREPARPDVVPGTRPSTVRLTPLPRAPTFREATPQPEAEDLVLERVGALRLRAVDARGAPLEGEFEIFARPLVTGTPGHPAKFTTGPDGWALAPRPMTAGTVEVRPAGVQWRTRLERVTIVEGATTDLAMTFEAAPGIWVTVLDDRSGAPVEGAHVLISRDGVGGIQYPTREDGRAFVPDIVPGRYFVKVSKEASDYVRLEIDGVRREIFPRNWQPQELTAAGIARGFVVRLIAGRRWSGLVVDPDGRPVEGAAVAATARIGSPKSAGTTSADGRFALDGISPGGNLLSVVHPRWVPAHFEVDVAEDGSGLPPEIRLERGAAIEGTVRAPDGRPVADAKVSIVLGPRSPGNAASAQTKSDGSYSLDGLRPGTVELLVEAKDHPPRRVRNVSVHLGAPERVDVTLEEGLTIEGRVVDDAGVPVTEPVAISCSRERFFGRGRTTTSAGGRFSFDGLEDGEYALSATAPGHDRARLDGVRAGMRDAVLVLERSRRLLVRIVGADLASLPQTTSCRIARGSRSEVRNASHDGAGRYALDGLGRDAGDITLTMTGFRPVTFRPPAIPPGGEAEIAVEVTPAR